MQIEQTQSCRKKYRVTLTIHNSTFLKASSFNFSFLIWTHYQSTRSFIRSLLERIHQTKAQPMRQENRERMWLELADIGTERLYRHLIRTAVTLTNTPDQYSVKEKRNTDDIFNALTNNSPPIICYRLSIATNHVTIPHPHSDRRPLKVLTLTLTQRDALWMSLPSPSLRETPSKCLHRHPQWQLEFRIRGQRNLNLGFWANLTESVYASSNSNRIDAVLLMVQFDSNSN
jgi:hypothetical protein